MFCSQPLSLTFVKEYISKSKYKQLVKDEIKALFNNDIALLSDTKRLMDEQEISLLYQIMTINNIPDQLTRQFLNDFGYIENNYNTIIKNCPNCDSLIHNLWLNENENLLCNVCNTKICDKCLNIKELEHICDMNIMTSIKLMNDTCRACPKCNIFIQKEDGGCDQMFCTQCNTTFSWITGKEARQNDTKHNPHFFEWQRTNGNNERHPNDNPCEGYFLQKCEKEAVYDNIIIIHTILQHSIETIDHIYERDEMIREYFRIEYLAKKITFKRWKNKFRKHVITQKRNFYVKQIIQICIETLYYIVLSHQKDNVSLLIDTLFSMITDALQSIQKTHGRNINYFITLNRIFLPYGRPIN
jgi:hypothetical protein